MGPHNETVIGVRAPVAKRDAAHAALKAEDWRLQEFISACLDALLADPPRFLRGVARHRPTPKPKGRPRKGQDTH